MVRSYLRSIIRGERKEVNGGKVDGLLWYKDLGAHAYGEFSMAVIQANSVIEDQSQIESGPLGFNDDKGLLGTFVGVYDGHGGHEASSFINCSLFSNFKGYVSRHREAPETALRQALLKTEEDFLSLVKKQWPSSPKMASVGSCCLVGMACNGLLCVANVGDSRAVLGRMEADKGKVSAIQLTVEHNANIESVRHEIWSEHPHDPNILVLKYGTWRLKGVIQVTRSIGDAYLKKAEFNRDPLPSRFRLPQPFSKPILSSEPSVTVHQLDAADQFIIFASDGLWEHLSNEEAVEIVHNSPRHGSGRRLVEAALREAARKREMRYSDLKHIDPGVRRHFHDDITVIVVYFDSDLIGLSPSSVSRLSLKGGGGVYATVS